ncbi:MAG: hypothetical protein A3B99_01475 [Candidatus Yanofskybacteria bacterium RIFCSPHIGHO2_02_FULL_44_12b]|uniref:Metal-dependent carboxypeptidase n=2 Tax=Candidatus Yanofskyibacteriota TaxID=1752733 RepID=A0A1F8GIX1_9BACT|nr:MAG: carboxypeptidase Taq [Candidatus Yanofskybacteria bacterium GW2011_GWA2_44_9]OGN05599.1 MAG: hypothetical protein A2659_04815 [Candidatus Yanofskybacteria bacterium RIFCSPHIGHO2_01_FULL_44_24]OGN14004.1 MAG: hypothetical protein A3B99_01475 [Candidatus Yanofskybacteria bacterium RIFCSPHIGHO2_02_FULL_44_12b]OGN25273.1 MAG: hypothetical protein A2925_01595 [Candidatus Yanofskybacteria bacterium RIFCSPLOWO2_01_FULL_44_22]
MANKSNLFNKFRQRLVEISHINSALTVLGWDEQVNMPARGSTGRGATTAYLAGLAHEKAVSKEFEEMLSALVVQMNAGELSAEESCVVREVARDFEKQKKLPKEFIEESARLTSEAHHVWVRARQDSDFNSFAPYLKKIVELKRRKAQILGFKKSPYDALLDLYEPGATVDEISPVLEEVKVFLMAFTDKIKKSSVKINSGILSGNFPIEEQKKFTAQIAEKIGFGFDRGRLDVSTHPFSTSFHPEDVRITTRYKDNDLFGYGILSTIHEVGHALYEQGLLKEHFGTPLGEAASLGIHESQSRMWENLVGKSRVFWRYFYPRIQEIFPEPFGAISLEDFYRALNCVGSSLIRTEADEVTYNLHVILRYEIEKELIEGSIGIEDLPAIWNSKMGQYLGIEVPSDSLGVLQDVHWSGGSIGYFPTYTLGNLYSAQFYGAAKRDILNLEEEIASGHFGNLLSWLRKNIHIHGRLYSADELVQRATGEKLSSKYFIDYITQKYSEIYRLD